MIVKKKNFIEIYECIFLLLLVILQTALLELKQHKETKLAKKKRSNNCITILDRGKGIQATVPDTRLAVAQFTLCLTCYEWISGSASSVNTCLGFDSSSIPGFLWNRFVCHPCIWVHVRLLWTHLQQVMNLFHIFHCHIFVWHINPSLSLRDFFFWLGFSKGFLHLCLFLMTVQNVLSNGKSYSGKQECGLAHTESPSFTHVIQKRASFH